MGGRGFYRIHFNEDPGREQAQQETLTYRRHEWEILDLDACTRRRVIVERAQEATERVFAVTNCPVYLRIRALKSLRNDIDDYLAILEDMDP